MFKSSRRRDLGCRISYTKCILVLAIFAVLLAQYFFWSLLINGEPPSILKSPLNIIQPSSSTLEDLSVQSALPLSLTYDETPRQSELDLSTSSTDGVLFEISKTTQLPALSSDSSELFLSSLIERTSHSKILHVTTFLLNTAVALPHKNRMEKIKQVNLQFGQNEWTEVIGKMSRVKYAKDGKRMNMSYSCRIFNSVRESRSYVVKGEFVPNTQSLDAHMNNRLDILRCPVIHSMKLHDQLDAYISSSDSLGVEIMRGNKVIGQISIPWEHRRVGYLMSPFSMKENVNDPPGSSDHSDHGDGDGDGDNHNNNNNNIITPVLLSGLDAWEGGRREHRSSSSLRGEVSAPHTEKFHLCVVGLHQLQTDARMQYRLVEFIEYHMLLGVHHMYLTFFNIMEDSVTFKTLITTLGSYIREGYISVTTTSENRHDFRHIDSILGLQFHRSSIEAFQVNSCLYLAKGVADYLGVWNVNEFLVPLPPSHSILTMIQAASVSSKDNNYNNNKNHDNIETDMDAKEDRGGISATSVPKNCFLSINSLNKFITSSSPSPNPKSSSELSITKRYSFSNNPVFVDNAPRLIMNTATIFQGGITTPGACFPSGSATGHMMKNDNISTASGGDNSNNLLRLEDGKSIHMNYEGYLYTLKPDIAPKQLKNQKGKPLTFIDDIAKSYFLRSEYKIKERFPQISEQNALVVIHEPETHNHNWKAYIAVFRPAYELNEGMKRSDMKGLSKQELLKYKSQNGYLHFDDNFILPTDTDTLQNTLPKFASDFSDIALGSIIERKYKSWDLFVTTFFIHHEIFHADKGYGILRIMKNKSHNWNKAAGIFSKAKYSPSGIRKTVGKRHYRCRIKNTENDMEYEVKGEFMPSKLSLDSNANNKLDIFRCQMKHTKKCYQSYAGSDENVEVTIINPNNKPILQYTIPWESRRSGYLLSSPSAADSFQPWKAFERNDSHHLPGGVGGDTLYMSVPGIDSPVSQKTLPKYLEFMQHHFLVGVQHMFAAGPYAWDSLMLSNFLVATQSFIGDGLLTFNSQAGDGINHVNSVLGASLDRDVVKVIYVNMCLYLTKGMVDYLAVWDIDEYFIPQLPHHSILEVIRAAEAPRPLTPLPSSSLDPDEHAHRGNGRGWADDFNHPFCYLMLSSEVIFSSLGYPEKYDQLKPWVGFKYPHLPEPIPVPRYAFKKTIIPTNRIFQAGLHMHGNCILDKKWNLAREHQAKNSSASLIVGKLKSKALLSAADADAADADAGAADYKRIPADEATIYHYQMHRSYEKADANSLLSNNLYTIQYFPEVLKELTRRGLNALVTIPDNAPIIARVDTEWLPFNTITLENDTLAKLKTDQQFGPLPAFARDLSESFIGSVMERSFDSRDLHITTFLFCHEEIRNEKSFSTVEPQSEQKWAKLRSLAMKRRYSETGMRNNRHNFYCKITNFHGGQSYTVKGHFIPNKLLVDSNANSKVDILRCPMHKSKYSINDLSRSHLAVSVEILQDRISLVKFRVPWKTRRVGFMMSADSDMSRLNMWKNLVKSDTSNEPIGQRGDALHMCVPGFESPIAKSSIAIYAEFLQHHYDLGVDHVHAAAAYKWGETNMNLFAEAFQSYVKEEFLSISSFSDDADRVPGWLGLSLDRDVVKVIYVNMCLYLTKGMVDYLAVWDIDEYFIPQLPHHSILEVIRAAETPQPLTPLPSSANPFELVDTWRGGRGWADGDGHPFCYLRLLSESLFRSNDVSERPDTFSPWIGNRYKNGPEKEDIGLNFEKSILPTRKIFQAGLHTGAGCKLEYPFSGCESSSSSSEKEEFCKVERHAQKYGYTIVREPIFNTTDFSFEQRFDGFIFNKDAKTLNPDDQAFLYHIQIHRELYVSESPADGDVSNAYVQRFYPLVLQNLRRRGIELQVIIPGVLKNKDVDIDKILDWIELDDL